VTVSGGNKKSWRGSRGDGSIEEEYIERERVRERFVPDSPRKEEYETYRYVEAPKEDNRHRSKSITYETNPRASGRTIERERERVVVEDGGRRREYYRRP
jgi:hypothetical protein